MDIYRRALRPENIKKLSIQLKLSESDVRSQFKHFIEINDSYEFGFYKKTLDIDQYVIEINIKFIQYLDSLKEERSALYASRGFDHETRMFKGQKATTSTPEVFDIGTVRKGISKYRNGNTFNMYRNRRTYDYHFETDGSNIERENQIYKQQDLDMKHSDIDESLWQRPVEYESRSRYALK
jgi:hypothetical protein